MELQENNTTEEVAAYLKIGLTKAKELIKTRELKSYKNGKLRRIKREWVLEYEKKLIDQSECS